MKHYRSVTTPDRLYRLETPALHCFDITECYMDQTLLKFVHSHWPPNDSQLQQGSPSITDSCLPRTFLSREPSTISTDSHNFRVPSDTCTKWDTCQLFLKPFSWLDTHWISSTSYPHISFCIGPQYLNQTSSWRPPSRPLIHQLKGSPPYISNPAADNLHASSPKSRAQHLANIAPNTSVKQMTNIAHAHNNTCLSSSHHTPRTTTSKAAGILWKTCALPPIRRSAESWPNIHATLKLVTLKLTRSHDSIC
jgi:hypothetical protein